MFFILCVTLAVLGASAVPTIKEVSPEPFDILKLTQSWPPAVCIYLKNEDKKCDIPSNVTGWVVHGLWPTKLGTLGPNYCNDSWKFDLSKVEKLRPTLDLNWPSVTEGEKSQIAWAHEWDKHGTCGASLPALKDEFLYFNVTLGLHAKFNLSETLRKGGISPSSENTYRAQDILKILQESLGVAPTVSCVKDKTTGKYYLEQVEVCLTKAFKPTSCDAHRPDNSLKYRPEAAVAMEKDPLFVGNVEECGSESEEIYYMPLSTN